MSPVTCLKVIILAVQASDKLTCYAEVVALHGWRLWLQLQQWLHRLGWKQPVLAAKFWPLLAFGFQIETREG